MTDGISLGKAKCIAKSRTGLALRVILDSDGKAYWIPISVIHDDSEAFDVGHEGDLIVNEWYAEKEGLT
jgi:hypothetical protein